LFTREVVMIRVSRIVSGFIFFLAVLTMWGQSFSGRIVGLVTDSSSAVLPTVAVSVVNEGTGAQRRLRSCPSGTTRCGLRRQA
jgi:hypothetical protein